MLSGFWLGRPELRSRRLHLAGCTAGPNLYDEVMQALVDLAEERRTRCSSCAGAPSRARALMLPKTCARLEPVPIRMWRAIVMNRRQYVYSVADGWQYEVWYGRALSVIGRAATRQRAETLASTV